MAHVGVLGDSVAFQLPKSKHGLDTSYTHDLSRELNPRDMEYDSGVLTTELFRQLTVPSIG